MKEPIIIVIVLFIIFGFAYEPLKKSNLNRNNSVNNPSAIGKTNNATGDTDSEHLSNKEIAENIKEAKKEIEKLEKNLNAEIAKNKRSPYYGKINMSSIYGLRQNNPDKEYIYLSTNLNKNESVKITGWFLKSEITNYYATIGKAALLPFPFTKTESDVILERGDRVYLTKGFSPIGISFRTNKCAGYFEENRTFTPGLPMQCPLAKDENLPNFSSVYERNNECMKLIERIPRCDTKGNEFVRDLPDTISLACKNYITTQINYNTCVATHLGDTDFPGNQYRIYLNKFGPLWRTTHDTINLYDENGLIVDTIDY